MHKNFVRFLKTFVFLQIAFNTCNEFDECFNNHFFDFWKNHCADCSDFNELKEIIVTSKLKITEVDVKSQNLRCKYLYLFIKD